MNRSKNEGNDLILKKFLPYRLSTLSNQISRSIADMYEERFALTIPEWRTIAILSEESEISAADVSDRTAMDKVAVSRAVKNLLKSGRITREFAPTDRRRSILKLSSLGRDIYDQVCPLALSYERALLDGLSEEEQEFLGQILNKLGEIQLHTVESTN